MKSITLKLCFLVALLSLVWGNALPAAAQLTLDFSTSVVPINGRYPILQGQTIPVTALLTNIGTEEITLDAAFGSITTGPTPSEITIDDIAFVMGLPLTLAPSATYQEAIFLTASMTMENGLYDFLYEVDGTGNTTFSPYAGFDSLPLAVPETNTLFLLGTGIVALCGVRIHRRKIA